MFTKFKIPVAAVAVCFSMFASASVAATYKMFDHPGAALDATYDYGLRLDGLQSSDRAGDFWSFEATTGKSLATMKVDIAGGVATLNGLMRHNLDGSLWTLNVIMSGVESLASIGAGADSFGATAYTGSIQNGDASVSYVLNGALKDVGGTGYAWTMFFEDPSVSADWRAPNISAGWVAGSSDIVMTGANDFIAEVAAVPLPASILFLGSGLAGFGLMRRRRKSA